MSRVHAIFYAGEVPRRSAASVAPADMGGRITPKRLVAALRGFYRDPAAWLALLTTSVVASYGGGALMFWFHAVALGEGGPAISWYAHWLLDSTFGFIGLTPALFVIIPFSAWASSHLAGSDQVRVPWLYVAITAGLFSLVTVPGPLAHDMIVGRGTWVAQRVTQAIGDPSASLAPVTDYPLVATLSQQLGAAVPTYLAAVALSLLVVRFIASRRRIAGEVERQAVERARQG